MKWRETISVSVNLLRNEVRRAWDRRVETLNATVLDAKRKKSLDGSSVPTKWSITKNLLKTAGRMILQIFVSVTFLAMLPMVGVSAMLRRKDVEYVVPKASKWYRTIPVVREPKINTHLEGEDAPEDVPPGHVNLGERP